MKKFYLLVVLAIFFICNSAKSQVSESDSLALVDFYNTAGGDYDTTGTWLSDKPVGEWYGVTVSNNRVTELSTENLNPTGTISPEIGKLTGLISLKLIGDEDGAEDGGPVIIELHGSIPEEIWDLTNLEKLQIKYTNITGDIPTTGIENMTALSEINFQQTYLGCEIPEEIFELPALKKAYLHQSNFIGNVPESLKDATGLTRLYLHGNKLDSLPFVDLTATPKVSIYGNYFSFETVKPYHDAKDNYEKLTDDYQYKKEPVDSIVELGSDFTIDGTVENGESYAWFKNESTSSVASTASLTFDDFELSDIGSYVCKAQSTMVSEFYIGTEYNLSLEGRLQDSLALVDFYDSTGADWATNWLNGDLDTWEGLALSNGRVTEFSTEGLYPHGKIPSSIGYLSELKILKLIGVEDGPVIIDLNGSIPEEIWDLTNLEKLQIKYTNITGDIPTSGIENMTALSEINFQQTYLGCEIPEEIFNLPSLKKAYLHQSNFIGNVPSSLENATNLTRLYLHDNKLDSIPFVDLSENYPKVTLNNNYFTFETVKPYHDANNNGDYEKLTDDYQLGQDTVFYDTIDMGESVDFEFTAENGEVYTWFYNENTTPISTSSSYSISSASSADTGTYTCYVQSSLVSDFEIIAAFVIENIADTTTIIDDDDTTSAIEVNYAAENISIYPNPFGDNITVESESAVKSVIIYDISGQKVLSLTSINNNVAEINTDALNAGIYYISIKSDKNSTVQKILKK